MVVIRAIFVLLATILLIWTVIGILPGTVFLILALIEKNKVKKTKFYKWTKLCLGGLGLLVVTFILYFLISILGALLGFSIKAF